LRYDQETSSFKGEVEIEKANAQIASLKVPENVGGGRRIHIICEVKDNGTPQLTRYKRIIITVEL